MKNKIILSFIIIIFIPLFIKAQNLEIKVKRERSYTGSGLYGFMNGGADLYLEYGVKSLVTRDIVYKNEEFTIDIYEMPSSEDAFGIYSLHTFKCEKADTLGLINCISPYQLQLSIGNKYISVVFTSGSNTAKVLANEVVQNYINITDYDKLTIPDILDIKQPYSGILKYLRGPLSVSNTQSSLPDIVKNTLYKEIWFINNKSEEKSKALIVFDNDSSVNNIKIQIKESDIIQTGENYIYINCNEEKPKENNFGPFGF